MIKAILRKFFIVSIFAFAQKASAANFTEMLEQCLSKPNMTLTCSWAVVEFCHKNYRCPELQQQNLLEQCLIGGSVGILVGCTLSLLRLCCCPPQDEGNAADANADDPEAAREKELDSLERLKRTIQNNQLVHKDGSEVSEEEKEEVLAFLKKFRRARKN